MFDKLAKKDKQNFADDGVIIIRELIENSWLELLRDAIERDIDNPGPCFHGYEMAGGGYFHGNMRLWENDADFAAYCRDSLLPEVAAELLGAQEIQLYYDQLFVKEPGTDAPTRWHNDQPYWPIRGWPILSFWLALDPVDANNGRLEFVRGSHRWDSWFQPEPFAKGGTAYELNPDYVPIPDINSNRDEYEFLSWDMNPGDVIAFHALTVHGGGANNSIERRRGYTVRYCGQNMSYYEGPGTSHFLNDSALKHGEPIKGDRYPRVWPR
ncbi:MAG: phytanoyl-CoA dioxygenase family protein [Pseudomonadota bacterium]